MREFELCKGFASLQPAVGSPQELLDSYWFEEQRNPDILKRSIKLGVYVTKTEIAYNTKTFLCILCAMLCGFCDTHLISQR